MEEVNRRHRTVLQVQVEELHLGFSPNPPMETDGRREDSGRG